MNKSRYVIIFLLGVILLAGLGLRIYKLSSHDLWYDEVASSYIAQKPTELIPYDKTPPLYYLFLHFWTKFFGSGEFHLRFLSVIFGVAAVFMLYRLGKLLFDKKVGLISAFLLALSPIHIWYSQEARAYTLSVLAVIVSVKFFILALRKNRTILWILFAISSAVSLYSSYYYLFIMPGELILLLSVKKYRCLINKWVICKLFILVSFLPLLKPFLNQVKSIKHSFWIEPTTLRSVFVSFENFNVGYNAGERVYFFSTILFLVLLIRGAIYCLRHCKDNLIILLSFSFVPISVIFLISKWIPVYIDRQLILYAPFYYMVIAIGIASIRGKFIIKAMIIALIFSLSATALYNYFSDFMPSPLLHHIGTHIKKPFKPAVNYVKERYRQGDVIVHSNPSTAVPFEYYWNIGSDNYPWPPSCYFFIPSAQDNYFPGLVRDITKEALVVRKGSKKHIQEINRLFKLRQDIRESKFGRIWLISSVWERDGSVDENNLAVERFLESSYIAVERQEFDGIFVILYTLKSG
jgi:mannosyltransferase